METEAVKVSTALQTVSCLFLDTAPVIYLIEKNPAYLDIVRSIFTAIDSGQITAMTSPVTLAECLAHPLRLNFPPLQQSFIDVVVNGNNTTCVNLDQAVGQQAARLRADYNVRLPDALQ